MLNKEIGVSETGFVGVARDVSSCTSTSSRDTCAFQLFADDVTRGLEASAKRRIRDVWEEDLILCFFV